MRELAAWYTSARGLAVAVVLVSALFALPACDDPDPAVCVSECSAEPLDDKSCEIALAMDANCQGYVETAEVAVGQCLEPQTVTPGETLITCARAGVGESFTWTVRSDTWQWGPWKDACGTGGARMVYQLGCK